MVAFLLIAANAAPVSVQNVGWTWSATMGLVQNLLLLGGGGGLAVALVRAGVQLKKIATDRAGKEDDRESARWREIMDFNASLTERVSNLEKDLREERRRCDEDMSKQRQAHMEDIAAMRREQAAEVRSLNEKIDGLQRILLQNQVSTANALDLSGLSPKASERFRDVMDKANKMENLK